MSLIKLFNFQSGKYPKKSFRKTKLIFFQHCSISAKIHQQVKSSSVSTRMDGIPERNIFYMADRLTYREIFYAKSPSSGYSKTSRIKQI